MTLPTLSPRLFKRDPLALIVALALGSAVPSAHALGFGRAQTTAVLGSPLDFRVGLRLEENEALDTSCVSSTVVVGDSLVPQSAISIVLDGAGANASLRVTTAVPMTEPVVVVSVSAGCTVRVTRRFTLFADPPGHRVIPVVAPPPPPAPASPAPAVPLAGFVVPTAPVAPPAVLPLAAPSDTGAASAAPPPGAAGPTSATAASERAPPPAPANGQKPASDPAPAPAQAVSAPAAPKPPSKAEKTAEKTAEKAAEKAPPQKASRAASKADAKAAPKAAAKAEPKSGAKAESPVAAAAPAPATASPTPPGTPRLKLEAPRISARVIDAAAAAEREAALRNAEEAAISAKAAAEAAERRASELERSIALLQEESKANREALLRLTRALEQSRDPDWSQALLAALVVLAGLAGFLLYRLRRLQVAARQGWTRVTPDGVPLDDAVLQQAPRSDARSDLPGLPGEDGGSKTASSMPGLAAAESAEPPASPASFLSASSQGAPAQEAWAPTTMGASESSAPPLPSLFLDAAPPPAPSADLDKAPDRPPYQAPSSASVSPPIRPVSIEELLDLEQQVEFYEVLGQDDAALELLVEHLRHTGGTYPLPFLKLMELYRRKGDADAYERTRDRFNQRFNAVAPAWDAPPAPDRGLDDYPEVMRLVQQAWSRPVDATAMLETMLFRTQGGELFDLRALADVLFLFTLARDLLENEGGEATSVDVLLPFDEIGSGDSDRVPLMELPSRSADARASRAAAVPDRAAPAAPARAGVSSPPSFVAAAAAGAGLGLSPSVSMEGDIDIPLNEPMLEPLFQPEAVSGPTHAARTASPAPAPQVFADPPPPELGLDLEFGDEAKSGSESSSGERDDRSLDFDLSDFDLPIATVLPAAGSSPGAADDQALDIPIEGLSLELAPRSPRGGGDGGGVAG